MVELVENVNLPFVQQLFVILIDETRRDLPRKIVEKLGADKQLGPNWKPGNPHFDAIVARLQGRFDDSERQGRLDPPRRRDIALTLRAAWTEEDLRFLTAFVKTETGKQVVEFIDLLVLPALRTALSQSREAPAAFFSRSETVARQADERFRAISAPLLQKLAAAKPDVDRAMALLKQVDGTSGGAIGQLWAGKLAVEILAIARDEMFEVAKILDDFRRTEGLPAPSRPEGRPAKI